MTTCLVALSDLHIGSTVALCPPRVQLDDGGYYSASRAQRWIWGKWKLAWERVAELSAGHDLWVVINGDIVDGDHHDSHQIFMRSPEEQMSLAISILEPVVRSAAHLFIVRGTSAHVGQRGWAEEKIADDLDAEGDKVSGTSSWWHLLLDCEGVLFDIAHHTTGGMLPWTSPNSMNRLAAQTIISYAQSGDRIPDVVIRSHKHKYKNSGDNYPVQAIGLPSWSLATEYIHRLKPGTLSDIGLVAFICDNKKYSYHPLIFRPKRNRPWTTKS